MKRNAYWIVAGALLSIVAFAGTFAKAQDADLAAYARHQKKEKPAAPASTKVFDNDNLPKEQIISVVGNEAPPPPANPATTSSTSDASASPDSGNASGKSADSKPTAVEPGQSQDDRQQAYGDWQTRIKQQKDALDLAQRELDVLQREYRLRTATVANDVGYRLRNSTEWDKEDKQYKSQIETKQKAVDEAKQKLADLQEEARKAGVPDKVRN